MTVQELIETLQKFHQKDLHLPVNMVMKWKGETLIAEVGRISWVLEPGEDAKGTKIYIALEESLENV